jgi:hypothetical protein
MSVHFQRTTRCHIPEDKNLHTFIQLSVRSHLAADTGIAFVTVKSVWRCAETDFTLEYLHCL